MVASPHHVELVVPASADYVEPVRLTAASLAAELGFDVEEVDDIRIAVHELFVLLLDDDQRQPAPPALPDRSGDEARIELRFDLVRASGCLRVTARRLDDASRALVDIDDITRAIVSAATDDWQLSLHDRPSFRVEKAHVGR